MLGAVSSVRGYGHRRAPGARFDAPLGGAAVRTIERPLRLSSEYLPPKEDGSVTKSVLKPPREYLPPGKESARNSSPTLAAKYLPPKTETDERAFRTYLLPAKEAAEVSVKDAGAYLPPPKDDDRVALKVSDKYLPPQADIGRASLKVSDEYLPPKEEAPKAALKLSDEYLPPTRGKHERSGVSQESKASGTTELDASNEDTSSVLGRRGQVLRRRKLAQKSTGTSTSRRQETVSGQKHDSSLANTSSQSRKSSFGSTPASSKRRGTKRYQIPDYLKTASSIIISSSGRQALSSGKRFGQLKQSSSKVRSQSQRKHTTPSSRVDETQFHPTSEELEAPSDADVELTETSRVSSDEDASEIQHREPALDSYSLPPTTVLDQVTADPVVKNPGHTVNIRYFTSAPNPAADLGSVRGHDSLLGGEERLDEVDHSHSFRELNDPISFGLDRPYEYGSPSRVEPFLNDHFNPVVNVGPFPGTQCSSCFNSHIDLSFRNNPHHAIASNFGGSLDGTFNQGFNNPYLSL